MILKKYIEFNSINESFYGSEHCSDFIKEYSLPDHYFKDNLDDVIDMENSDIKLIKYIVDYRGNLLKEFLDDDEYKIKKINMQTIFLAMIEAS